MSNLHWMIKDVSNKNQIQEILNISNIGYKSFLLPFQTFKDEPFILSTYLCSKVENQKFMIAVRPYTISALHLALMCKTFKEFYGDRLIINFVAGTYDIEQEMFSKIKMSKEERKQLLQDFIKDFIGFVGNSKPEIFISGSSQKTFETVSLYGDGCVLLLSDFYKNKEDILKLNKKIIARVSISNKIVSVAKREENNSIFGNINEIKNQILFLEKEGITDFLISGMYSNPNWDGIHSIVDFSN